MQGTPLEHFYVEEICCKSSSAYKLTNTEYNFEFSICFTAKHTLNGCNRSVNFSISRPSRQVSPARNTSRLQLASHQACSFFATKHISTAHSQGVVSGVSDCAATLWADHTIRGLTTYSLASMAHVGVPKVLFMSSLWIYKDCVCWWVSKRKHMRYGGDQHSTPVYCFYSKRQLGV